MQTEQKWTSLSLFLFLFLSLSLFLDIVSPNYGYTWRERRHGAYFNSRFHCITYQMSHLTQVSQIALWWGSLFHSFFSSISSKDQMCFSTMQLAQGFHCLLFLSFFLSLSSYRLVAKGCLISMPGEMNEPNCISCQYQNSPKWRLQLRLMHKIWASLAKLQVCLVRPTPCVRDLRVVAPTESQLVISWSPAACNLPNKKDEERRKKQCSRLLSLSLSLTHSYRREGCVHFLASIMRPRSHTMNYYFTISWAREVIHDPVREVTYTRTCRLLLIHSYPFY